MQPTILPLFSSPVAIFDVQENLEELQKLKTNYEFCHPNSDHGYGSGCEATVRKDVLNDFLRERSLLQDYLNFFKNSCLKLENTEFSITTSWATRLKPGAFSQPHDHCNSFFSGVFYLDSEYQGGELVLYAKGSKPTQFLLNDPSQFNLFNSSSWEIPPVKNRLIIFPSYISHSIKPHKGDNYRHSLALNWFPIGQFGRGDSSVNLSIIN